MSFVRVTEQDVPDVVAYLSAHAEYAMFPLNNLIQFGLDGAAEYAPNMWRNRQGPLRDILSITNSGMVMPYLPSGHFEEAARVLAGREITGFIGPRAAARGVQAALGMAGAEMELDADEGHFNLDLADLHVPDGATRIVPASEELRAPLTEWMTDYHISILGMSAEAAAKAVPDRLSKELEEERRVVLMQDDRPVATTAFNAALPEIVQIGGVYTPRAHRGQGHARRAVALHLERMRTQGTQKATLFANHPSAIAAYEAVGFKRIGDWLLAVLKTPQSAQGVAR